MSLSFCLLLLSCLQLCVLGSYPATPGFQILTSTWSSCRPINASSQECFMTREAVCVRTAGNITAPWYYCLEEGSSRPETLRSCPGHCEQGCAVSQWSAWSSCDCSSSPYSHRSRRVVSPPRNEGRACPGLLERELCPCAKYLPFDAMPRRYSWETGVWGECRPQDTLRGCGHGLRTRTVGCVDQDGTSVAPENCLNETSYARLLPPSPQRLCEVACPCVLGEWGDYSPCRPLCGTRPLRGVQSRSRPILRPPTLELTCDDVVREETRTCSVSSDDIDCPTHIWETSGWSACQFQVGAGCGLGHMTRHAYCMEVLNDSRTVVEDNRCDASTRPQVFSQCWVPCPQGCLVGEWSGWSACPNSSEQTYHNRTRHVLVPPLGEGQEACPHIVEYQLCPALPEFRWQLQDYISCFVSSCSGGGAGSQCCGRGEQSRSAQCVDAEGGMVSNSRCSHLPPPVVLAPCHVPCPNDCVVSDWSEWSPCSEKCDGRVGNRTRHRHFVALGLTCPYEDHDLVESEPCSDPRACELPRYHIRAQPWGACVPDEGEGEEDHVGSSGSPADVSFEGGGCGSGHGLRNRTSVCVKDGRVIPAEDCPIPFQPVEHQHCQIPCPSQCGFSDWSAFSECPTACGVSGTKRRRVRYLIEEVGHEAGCGVEPEGLEDMDEEVCPVLECAAVGVAWRDEESDWSRCRLYERVDPHEATAGSLISSSCGLGYQNRTVSCVETSTNLVVPDIRCYEEAGPRPAQLRPCHQQCTHRCLVTEWEEFNRCEFNGSITRRRQIIPRVGCEDWGYCCPELSSISLVQTHSCPSFSSRNYIVEVLDNADHCILDSPLDTCGNGMEYERRACIDLIRSMQNNFNPRVIVDAIFCNPNPVDVISSCNIRCQRNCVQSEWSAWGPCSATCGSGYRVRMRSTVTDSREGGRPCGSNMETDVCFNEPCPHARVVPGPYGGCVPANTSSLCGAGERMREPLCFVDNELRDYSQCVGMGVTVDFALSEPCVADCPGVCVVGEWGAWSLVSCNTNSGDCPLCQQRRQRVILRHGNDGQCLKMTQESRTCEEGRVSYQWTVDPWKNCTIATPNLDSEDTAHPGHYCGSGVESRRVRCVNASSGTQVPDQLCLEEAKLTKPVVSRNCTLHCPVDCRVGAFSEWTACEGCVFNSMQRRWREVLVPQASGGEACPELNQSRACIPTNCSTLVPVSHAPLPSPDYTLEGQCGAVLESQPVSCHLNTVFLPSSDCPNHPSESYTHLPCPLQPNCTYGEWSDWSDCVTLCHTPGASFSFRTRELVSSLPQLAPACQEQQQEQRECAPPPSPPTQDPDDENGTSIVSRGAEPTTDPACLEFLWQASEWNQTGREVYCQSNTGTRVDNQACASSIMPRSQNQTCVEGACPNYATCSDARGVCEVTCQLTFERVEGACLPRGGCVVDDHCLLRNMECSSRGTCECAQGYLPSPTYEDTCIPVPPPVTTTVMDPGTTSTESDVTGTTDVAMPTTQDLVVAPETDDTGGISSSSSTGPVSVTTPSVEQEGLGIIHIILIITLPLIFIILLVVILIVVMYRCGRRLDSERAKTELKRRRMKASISSPSPMPQTAEEMRQRTMGGVGDSNSSGFVSGLYVEGTDAEEYGLGATTFLGARADIDEPYDHHYSPQLPGPSPRDPIPIIAPVPPGRSHSLKRGEEPVPMATIPLQQHPHHQYPRDGSLPGHTHMNPPTAHQQVMYLQDFPDGGVTTDMTYTTDEDTIGTTSIPPSSVGGSPNTTRRPLPPHLHPSPGHEHAYQGHAHELSGVTSSENPYVSMHRMSPQYAKVRRGEEKYRDQSLSPHHTPGYASGDGSFRYPAIHPGEKDTRISVGLDNSMIRAVNQLDDGTCHTPTSIRSSQSRSSQRRRGRRRRHHGRSPRYDHSDGRYQYDHYYHHGGRYRSNEIHYRSDGHYSSDHDHYSTSDAEYPPNEMHSPVDYEAQTLPHPPPHVHFSQQPCPPRSGRHDYEWGFYPDEGEYHRRHHSQGSPAHKSSRWYQQVQDVGHSYPPPPPHGPEPRRDYYQHHHQHHHHQRHHSSSSSHHRRHPSSPRQTPPPSPREPPPNFGVPPVPPHAQSPLGSGEIEDDYDYPATYVPHQVLKLKEEAERERNNPYARPRPLNTAAAGSSKEQVPSRIESPYDYPRIRRAGGNASPHMNSDPATGSLTPKHVSYSSPQISQRNHHNHAPQQQAGHAHTLPPGSQPPSHEALEGGVAALQTSRSTNLPPQPYPPQQQSTVAYPPQQQTLVAPQSYPPQQQSTMASASEVTPQPSTEVTPQPSCEATPQPGNTSTPNHRTPRPNLTIQVTPLSDFSETSPPASPYLSRRCYPPSPLVLHSNSVSEDSPRTSGEILGVGESREQSPQHLQVQQ